MNKKPITVKNNIKEKRQHLERIWTNMKTKTKIIGLVLMKKVGATAILINQNGKMDKRLDTMM